MHHKRIVASASAFAFLLTIILAAPAWAKPNVVMAWGNNASGQLGFGPASNAVESPKEVKAWDGEPAQEVVSIAGNDAASFALLKNGDVMASGKNNVGQLGDGTLTNTEKPVKVCAPNATEKCPKGPFLTGVAAIAAGSDTALALKTDGTVVAWGENENGELGVESPEKCEAEIACSKTPVEVPGLRKVEAIRSGGHTNYALVKETEKEPNKVMAWGFNADGELGNETTIDSTTPEPVKVRNGSGTLEPLTDVSAITSDSLTAFALKEGNVLAWGQNERGSLGYGATEGPEKCEEAIGLRVSCSTLPLPVKGLPGGEVTAISAGAGGYSGAALLKNKTVMDWGYNDWGELGDNESVIDEDKEASKGEAVHVCAAGVTVPKCPHGPYLGNVASIGSASYTNEALLSSGRLMMWGNGERGELGNGKKGNEKERNYSELPVEVPALREVAAIFHTPLSVLVLKNTQRPPRFYLNEALAVAKLESTLGAGEVTLENKVLGTIKCRVLDNGTVDNQTERGQAAIDAFLASPCTSAQHPSCPGIFATAEKPLESASEKTEPVRGALTTPWSGEAYNIAESETSEFRRLEAAHVGITVVVPPCEARLGMEVFFEGTLVPRIVNGTKNGLSPSHLVFDPGTAGLLYGTVLPETENTLTVSGNVKLAGETAFELIQAK